MISVVVPVGPSEANEQWLRECIDSVVYQTLSPAQVVLVDDGNRDREHFAPLFSHRLAWQYWKAPWKLGVAAAFNCGIGLSHTDLNFMLGSDDWLEPQCLEACWKLFHQVEDVLGYYFVGVRYSDGRTQDLACHAAMVTKQLWHHTGGFPPETAVGAPDAAFISVLLAHGGTAGRLWPVQVRKPLYNYRVHPDTDTAGRGHWQGVILETRRILTEDWKPCTP